MERRIDNLIIAAAQSASIAGNVDRNMSTHLKFIRAAASVGANLIVFPELSLTGYELGLASALQLESDDPRIAPLRIATKEHDMHVLVGAPWASGRAKPYLGAFLLSPERSICYGKIHVTESEGQYFLPGENRCVVLIDGVPAGIAICADTSHASHAASVAERGAKWYAASVMKTDTEYRDHATNMRRYAACHEMVALTANYAGSTGGSVSAGKSAFWDEQGNLVVQANSNGEAFVVVRREAGGWHGEVITL